MKKNIKKIISAILATTILSSLAVFAVYAETETNNSIMSVEYDAGNAVEPEIQLFSSGTKLVKGTDYELTYENNVNVGEATINVIFKGNYTGTRTVNFNITPQELTTDTIEISSIEAQTFTGSAITPMPTITYNGVTLEKDTDYELSYENNINAGTAIVNVTFKGNYSGTVSTSFEILAKVVTETNVVIEDIPEQKYTGSEIKPELIITYMGI